LEFYEKLNFSIDLIQLILKCDVVLVYVGKDYEKRECFNHPSNSGYPARYLSLLFVPV